VCICMSAGGKGGEEMSEQRLAIGTEKADEINQVCLEGCLYEEGEAKRGCMGA